MIPSQFHILVIVLLINTLLVQITSCVELDLIDCGIDRELDVHLGNVEAMEYPWLGILYYTHVGAKGETRAVTPVVLVQEEFVLANAADIGPMPKKDFRKQSKVLLGQRWVDGTGRRVRNYVLHPEYGETFNTVALVQLKDPVKHAHIKPLCPPPSRLINPVFYVMKFDEDYSVLQKQVLQVIDVPSDLCKEFYTKADLDSEKMLPPQVTCTVSLEEEQPCVWNAGSALVSRDVWGRWMLLGLGVRGPGCGAPARFLDMGSYMDWLQISLSRFQRITISKINKQSYVLRSGGPTDGDEDSKKGDSTFQRFGACDEEEKTNLLYREHILLETTNTQYQFLSYNMSIQSHVEYSCLTLQLVNASAVAEMKIVHYCPRNVIDSNNDVEPPSGPAPCYFYESSYFVISAFLIFSEGCIFEMNAWGQEKDMSLLDIQDWKLKEGSYYKEFTTQRHEYRGQQYMTDFGFEPLDQKIWVPEYDVWTTTAFPEVSSHTTPLPSMFTLEGEPPEDTFVFIPSTTVTPSTPTMPRTKRTFKRKSTTTARIKRVA